MINNVVLVGRLTKAIEVKMTQSGIAVATFTLAVNRQFTNAQGEREADFIQCVIWRKGAENLAKFTHKGSLIGVQGSIQTRNFENQQGQRVYVTEVVAGSFALLESKNAKNGDFSNSEGLKDSQNQKNTDFSNQFDENDFPF